MAQRVLVYVVGAFSALESFPYLVSFLAALIVYTILTIYSDISKQRHKTIFKQVYARPSLLATNQGRGICIGRGICMCQTLLMSVSYYRCRHWF